MATTAESWRFTLIEAEEDDEGVRYLTLICPEGHPKYRVKHNVHLFSRFSGGCSQCKAAGIKHKSTGSYKPSQVVLSDIGIRPMSPGSPKQMKYWQCLSGHIFLATYCSLVRKNREKVPVCPFCEITDHQSRDQVELISVAPDLTRHTSLCWKCTLCGTETNYPLMDKKKCSLPACAKYWR